MTVNKRQKTRLKGPWKSVQTAIWLIGLAILAINDWWWPGILVLLAVSTLSQAAIQAFVPGVVEEVENEKPTTLTPGMSKPAIAEPVFTRTDHPTERLPSECPKCSAPIRGIEVRWTGAQSADCPYCGANLPLKTI
jgi:hypothetical protein